MLVQSESEKLKEREVKHNGELKEWRDSLAPRKRVRYFNLFTNRYNVWGALFRAILKNEMKN